MLLTKLYSLSPQLKDKSFNANKKLLYRILKKNNITLRKATHLGQPLPDNSFDKVYNFIYEVINKRKKLSIFDDNNNLDRLINIDETPVFLELVNDKTYEVKGAKNVITINPTFIFFLQLNIIFFVFRLNVSILL